MINYSFDQLIELFYRFLLPFCRISSFFLAAPFFNLDALSIRVRITIALLFTIIAVNLINFDTAALSISNLYSQIVIQLVIGIFSGLLLIIINAAITVAGQAISNSMGLGMANMVDPSIGSVPLISQFLILLSTLIFLSIDGHLIIANIIIRSFEILPLGQTIDINLINDYLFEWTPLIFLAGLTLSLPILVSVLLINIGLGIITRSAPSLNIISVGFPIIMAVGFIALLIVMPGLIVKINMLWNLAFEIMFEFFGGD